MTISFDSLADGQVANTPVTALYTVPASTSAVLKYASFFNTNATQQTVDVYVTRSGGTRRQVKRFILDQYDTGYLFVNGETMELSAGDALEAITTTASAVDYLVTGATDA